MNSPSVEMRRATTAILAGALALSAARAAFAGASPLAKFESPARKAGITGFVPCDDGLRLTNRTQSIRLPLGSRQLGIGNSIVWLHEPPELPYRATSGWRMSRADIDNVLLAILAPTQGPPAKLLVAIDAGHGGEDGGASSFDGSILEKDFTLDMAFRLGRLISDAGMEVVYTRTNDVARTLSSRPAFAAAKKADIFVSIHANTAGNSAAAGCETYVIPCTGYPATGGDSGMATKWRSGNKNDFLNNVLAYQVHSRLPGRRKGRDRGLRRARYQILREATCPAILIECGFLSNKGDVKRLKSNWYREIFAEAIRDGIIAYAERVPPKREEGTGEAVESKPAPEAKPAADETPAAEAQLTTEEAPAGESQPDEGTLPATEEASADVAQPASDEAPADETPAADEPAPAADVAQPVSGEEPAAGESQPVEEERPETQAQSSAEEAQPAEEETPASGESQPDGGTLPATEEAPADVAQPASDEAPADEAPAADEPAPATDEAQPSEEEAPAPAADESRPAADEATTAESLPVAVLRF